MNDDQGSRQNTDGRSTQRGLARPAVGEIPTFPGVYRFYGTNDRVLYVGKAKNLRARLSNYFGPVESLYERTRLMLASAIHVDWTVVRTEIEALQLEYSWIKSYNPPFNVVFRDDKSYPYIAVTLKDEAPRAIVTRKRNIPGAKYFGPFPQVWSIYETLDLIQRAIPIRTCKPAEYERAMKSGKACFASQIDKCGGPCSQKISIEDHREKVEQVIRVLSGQTDDIVEKFTNEMHQAAEHQEFEHAAQVRDRLASLQQVIQSSAVILDHKTNCDVFGVAYDELSIAVEMFQVRNGRINAAQHWTATLELDTDPYDALRKFIFEYYSEAADIPSALYVPFLPDEAEELESWLMQHSGKRVRIRTAHRGQIRQLLDTVQVNAAQALNRFKMKRAADYLSRTKALTEIQSAIGMEHAPLRIESFDISHLAGTNIVASMVVFEDGVPKKRDYRSFNIQEARDDTDAMYQTLSRRLARLENAEEEEQSTSFSYFPQLILVDGGLPQVNAAQKALQDSALLKKDSIVIAGLAKRLEEIWLPLADFPLILPRNSEGLYLLQRIRDEAHRFALKHQKKHRKKSFTSELSEIPQVGPKRQQQLLSRFGSVAAIKKADVHQIAQIPGFSVALAQHILDHLHDSVTIEEN